MQPLQLTRLLLLLALCLPLGQADNTGVTASLSTTPNFPVKSLSPSYSIPPLLSLALGLAVAFFLHLR